MRLAKWHFVRNDWLLKWWWRSHEPKVLVVSFPQCAIVRNVVSVATVRLRCRMRGEYVLPSHDYRPFEFHQSGVGIPYKRKKNKLIR